MPTNYEYNYHLLIKTIGDAWINLINYNYDEIKDNISTNTKCYIAHKNEISVMQNGVFELDDLLKKIQKNPFKISIYTKDGVNILTRQKDVKTVKERFEREFAENKVNIKNIESTGNILIISFCDISTLMHYSEEFEVRGYKISENLSTLNMYIQII